MRAQRPSELDKHLPVGWTADPWPHLRDESPGVVLRRCWAGSSPRLRHPVRRTVLVRYAAVCRAAQGNGPEPQGEGRQSGRRRPELAGRLSHPERRDPRIVDPWASCVRVAALRRRAVCAAMASPAKNRALSSGANLRSGQGNPIWKWQSGTGRRRAVRGFFAVGGAFGSPVRDAKGSLRSHAFAHAPGRYGTRRSCEGKDLVQWQK